MVTPVGSDDAQLEVMQQEEQEEFLSEEARLDFLRARRRRIMFWSLLGVALFAVAGHLTMYRLGWYGQRDKGDGGKGRSAPVKIDPVGNPSAKVKIECILPTGSGCHDPVVKLLQTAAKRRPDRIRVEFEAMEGMADRTIKLKVGEVCAGVLINGKREFDIEKSGQRRRVRLVGAAPSHFSLYDLADALTQVYVREYGPVEGEPLVDLPPKAKHELERTPKETAEQAESKQPAEKLKLDLPPALDLELSPTQSPSQPPK
ncbi:MAG: hypothetical protein GXP31_19080 [Kiritimatiellaeota bacterium]|nr:hypothetical protein [Kiritimatiellota bacterium]